jgi:hypothetical protein
MQIHRSMTNDSAAPIGPWRIMPAVCRCLAGQPSVLAFWQRAVCFEKTWVDNSDKLLSHMKRRTNVAITTGVSQSMTVGPVTTRPETHQLRNACESRCSGLWGW